MDKPSIASLSSSLEEWACWRLGGPDVTRLSVDEQGRVRYHVLFYPLQTRAALLKNIADAILMNGALYVHETDCDTLAIGSPVRSADLQRMHLAVATLWGRYRPGSSYQYFRQKLDHAERLVNSIEAMRVCLSSCKDRRYDLQLASELNWYALAEHYDKAKRWENTLVESCPENVLASCPQLNATYLRLRGVALEALEGMVQRRSELLAQAWVGDSLKELLALPESPKQERGEQLVDFAERFCKHYLRGMRFLQLFQPGKLSSIEFYRFEDIYEGVNFEHPALQLLADFTELIKREALAWYNPDSEANQHYAECFERWIATTEPLAVFLEDLRSCEDDYALRCKAAIWSDRVESEKTPAVKLAERRLGEHYEQARGLVKYCEREGLSMVQESMWLPQLIEQSILDRELWRQRPALNLKAYLKKSPPAWTLEARLAMRKRTLRQHLLRCLNKAYGPMRLCDSLWRQLATRESTWAWLQSGVEDCCEIPADPRVLRDLRRLKEQLQIWCKQLERRGDAFADKGLVQDWRLEGFEQWLDLCYQGYKLRMEKIEWQVAQLLPSVYTVPESEQSVFLCLGGRRYPVSLERVVCIGTLEPGPLSSWNFSVQDSYTFQSQGSKLLPRDGGVPDAGFQMTPALLHLLTHWIHHGTLPDELAQIYWVQLCDMMDALFPCEHRRSWDEVRHPLH